MGLIEQLSEALKPHTDKLGQDAAFHMRAVHNKLHAIENAVNDLGRGDIGSKWQRFQIKKKFEGAETFEIGVCPVNEIWLIQALSSDGVQEKSPAYVILANGVLIESVIKEGLGFEGIGGDQVVLPGETLELVTRAAGSINCVITIIRREYPVIKKSTDYGRDTDRFDRSDRSTHDVNRDQLMQRLGSTYHEAPPETVPGAGRTG